jgi:hypothetical protein
MGFRPTSLSAPCATRNCSAAAFAANAGGDQSYGYYLTRIGRAAIAAASRVTQFAIIPALA